MEIVEINKDKKKQLRQKVVAQRRDKTKEERVAGSNLIAESIINWPVYQNANSLMLYLCMPDEPDMGKIIVHALANDKIVCVPHMYASYGQMDAAIIKNLDDLVRGKFNLIVPNPETLQIFNAEELDLIIVPGAAYDRMGHRLGMGGGYYDRFLPRALKAKFIGAVWQENILDNVPVDEHDRLVNYLVSEEGIFTCPDGKM